MTSILLSSENVLAQSFADLLKSGKQMVTRERAKSDAEKASYTKAITTLEQAVK